MKTLNWPCLAAALTATLFIDITSAQAETRFDSAAINGLGIRNIGSAAMSGRIAAVAATEKDGKTLLYVGAASGGVWKSENGGTNFKPVFDLQSTQSIGALAIDPSNTNTLWVGTGEGWTRNSVSVGTGIYKSVDGGDNWAYMGLPESERIVRIIVHPSDSNTVYACVPGKLWSDSAERGLYKTSDGGKSWQLIVKGSNLSTGCADVAMDPKNPDKLFVSMWDFRRKGWTFRSGGESPESSSGSALLVTQDAGKSWTNLDNKTNKGLPPKPWGRIGLAVAPSDNKIVYAVIESTRSALFRSDDGGGSWEERDRSQMMVWRPFYFSRLFVDPKNPDRVFKPDLGLIVSNDGGKSFSYSGGGAHGDWHDIWINPNKPTEIIGGDDGGLWLSHDGGNRWWKGNNLPISQFYHVSVDNDDPYHVYGGLQDNACWIGDSAYPNGITNGRWENICGGDGFFMFADPADENYVYAETQGGSISRTNRHTYESRDIQPKANYKEKLRFNWNTPMHLSPNEKGTLYLGAQFLFRTRDHGQSWDRISPDLTSNDPNKQKQEMSGGVTVDNSAAEMHTTIYTISESPKDGQVIWVGTDDGNVQLTRDGGKSWKNLVANIKGLPANSWVSWIEASRFDAGTAYATFDRHTFGDMKTRLYKTSDYGKTWTALISGDTNGTDKGVRGYAHVIREDFKQPNLLFLGTESGLWMSIDGGQQWAQFKGNHFPGVAVRDIVVQERESDLVVATHGRGIWIIDDITPLRAISMDSMSKEAMFLAARPIQQRLSGFAGWVEGDAAFSGENPPSGAVISYYQKSRHLFGNIKLEILDSSGKLLDTLPASKQRGINRVQWNMRVKPPLVPPAAQLAFYGTQGPRVVPGDYIARLTKGKAVYETHFSIQADRRAHYSQADRQAQFDSAMRVHHLFGQMSELTARINIVRETGEQMSEAMKESDALKETLEHLVESADDIRKEIVATKEGGAITGEERLREHVDQLYGSIVSYDGRPGDYHLARLEALTREFNDIKSRFEAFVKSDLSKANQKLKARKLPPIVVPDTLDLAENNLSSSDTAQVIGALLSTPGTYHFTPRVVEND